MGKNKKLVNTLLELVVLALIVGLIPELFVNGLKDLWGVCGFEEMVCQDLKLQGAVQLVSSLALSIFAVTVAFLLSKEYNSKDTSSKKDDES